VKSEEVKGGEGTLRSYQVIRLSGCQVVSFAVDAGRGSVVRAEDERARCMYSTWREWVHPQI
jgi:hypothetical protein